MNLTKRARILVVVAALVAGVFAIRAFWPSGRISVDFVNVPLGKVIPRLEGKTHLDLETNLPPETPVTLQMQDAEIWEVLLTLASRLDARIQPTVLAAPDSTQIAAALESYRAGKRFEGWEVFRARGGDFGAGDEIDASALALQLEPSENLHRQYEQIAAKTGLSLAAPDAWNPPAILKKEASSASETAIAAAKKAGGKARHLYLITGRPQRPDGDRVAENQPPGDGQQRPWEGGMRGPRDGGQEGGPNPEWEKARAETLIAALPEDQRKDARAEYDEFRKFREEMRSLSEEERRAKAEEFFSRPDVQERMTERMNTRDNRSSPDQRQTRMQKYVERKSQMKSQGK